MPLSPEDIENRDFLVALRGYDKDQVVAFLREVAADYRELMRASLSAAEQDPVAALGSKVASIVRHATEVAAEIRAEAERDSQALLAAAEQEIQARRDEAERTSQALVAAAEKAIQTRRSEAERDMKEVREAAEQDAAAIAEAWRDIQEVREAAEREAGAAAQARHEAEALLSRALGLPAMRVVESLDVEDKLLLVVEPADPVTGADGDGLAPDTGTADGDTPAADGTAGNGDEGSNPDPSPSPTTAA